MAERLESMHVERNVVVNQENGAGAVVSRVSDVSQDAVESVGVKVASAHFHSLIGFAGKTRVIAANNDLHAGLKRAQQIDDSPGSAALEGHHRKPDYVGIKLTNQPGDRVPHVTMAENEIGNGYSVVGIDVPCE